MDYRYAHIGRNEEENGPLFFKDLMGVWEDRRKHPETCLIISIEDDDSPQTQMFWTNQQILSAIIYKCRVVRIKKNQDQILLLQFNQITEVHQFPTIYIFGPNSIAPSFAYVGRVPNPFEFLQNFASLECQEISTNLSTAKPTFTTPDPANLDDVLLPKEEGKIPENEEDNEAEEFAETVKHQQKMKQTKPKEDPEQLRERSVEITLKFKDGSTHTKLFRQTETVISVNTWALSLAEPGSSIKLIIDQSNEPFPTDPFTALAPYKPGITLRVENDVKKPTVKKAKASFFQSLSSWFSFLSDFSPFADEGDDPADFWKKEPQPRKPKGRRVGF